MEIGKQLEIEIPTEKYGYVNLRKILADFDVKIAKHENEIRELKKKIEELEKKS